MPLDNGTTEPGISLEDSDRRFLDRARELAREGWGRVHPNPMVGCLVVRDGSVVAEGYHAEFGGLHAERAALREAGPDARGATVYVSLEPCSHHGKTPPCTEALIEAGVARVVYGGREPSSVAGGGGDVLRKAGIDVVGPVLRDAVARSDNPGFYRRTEGGRPYLEVKLALSLDAKIAERPGVQTLLSGPKMMERVHRQRAGFSAILVGSGTAEADDPRLTVRHGPPPRVPPTRLIVDSHCALPPDAALFDDVEEAPVVVFIAAAAALDRIRPLEEAGARVVPLPPSEDGVDLAGVLRWCEENGLPTILCEGGGRLATSLIRSGLCDRLHLLFAPRILGIAGVPAFTAEWGEDLLQGWRPVGEPVTVEEDVAIVLEPEREPERESEERESERATRT